MGGGALAGILTGVIYGVLPSLGLLLLAVAVAAWFIGRAAQWMSAGMTTTTGATFAALLMLATLRCQLFDSQVSASCSPAQPILPWLIGALAVVLAGLLATARLAIRGD